MTYFIHIVDIILRFLEHPRTPEELLDDLDVVDSGRCMIRPSFLSSPARLELLACVKRQREDHGIGRRANALLLLDDGMSCAQVAQVHAGRAVRPDGYKYTHSVLSKAQICSFGLARPIAKARGTKL